MILHDLIHDLRFGGRSLARRPGFTAMVILIIGVGIGATTTVLSMVNAMFFSVPEHVAEPEKLVRVHASASRLAGGPMSHPDYLHYRANVSTLTGLAAYSGHSAAGYTTGDGNTAELDLVFASDNFFDVLGVRMAAGRPFSDDENQTPGARPVAVVNHAFWQSALSSRSNVVGSTLTINNIPVTVIGVAPPGFKGVSPVIPAPDAWLPLAMFGEVTRATNMAWWERVPRMRRAWLDVVGRVADGVPLASVEANFSVASAAIQDEGGDGVLVRQQLRYKPDQEASLRSLTTMLAAAVALVLAVAMANVALLLLTWASTRRSELSVRSALGAGRGRIARQLLAESLLLGIAGGATGVALAFAFAGAAGALIPITLDLSFQPDGSLVTAATALAVLTAVIAGSVPAIGASRTDLRGALHAARFEGTGGAMRHALVVGQIALSLALVAGAFLFATSFRAAVTQPIGFAAENRLLVTIDLRSYNYDETRGRALVADVLTVIRARPGVLSTTTMSNVPFRTAWTANVLLPSTSVEALEQTQRVYLNAVSDDYFRTMEIPLLQGRALDQRDRAEDPYPVVISSAMAELMAPGQNALGKRFDPGYGDAIVVGVVADAAYRELGEDPLPQVYLPLASVWDPIVTFAVHTADPSAMTLRDVRDVLRHADPLLVITSAGSMEQIVDEQVARYKVSAVLVGTFGLIGLVLAAAGLYSVVSFLVARRTREIGVRMALGAGQRQVARTVVVFALKLATAGIALGVLGGLWLRRFTAGMVYGVEPTAPLPLLLASVTLLGATLMATWLPARRASRVDPLVAMRTD